MKTVISLDGTIENMGAIQASGPAVASVMSEVLFIDSDLDETPPPLIQEAGETAGSGMGTQASQTVVTAAAVSATSGGLAPLVINASYGGGITGKIVTLADIATTAQIQNAINTAINFIQRRFTSNVPIANASSVVVNIAFDYGFLAGVPLTALSGSGRSQGNAAALDYATLRQVMPGLPATDPIPGIHNFYVTESQIKTLGIQNVVLNGAAITPTSTEIDGYVGLNTVVNGLTLAYDPANQSVAGQIGAIGLLEHEITEVLGRVAILGNTLGTGTPFYSVLDLFRFSGSGVRPLTAGTAASFSTDTGATLRGGFNTANGGDAADWSTTAVPGDAFDAFLTTGTAGVFSTLDSKVMSSIGLTAIPGYPTSSVVLRNDDGTAVLWQMNGNIVTSNAGFAALGPTWHVKGLGDFNGDGKADILWQNDDGSVAVWNMNGATVLGGGGVYNPGTSWRVRGSGDFNGDGASDILLQNDDGTVVVWEMNSNTVIGGGAVFNAGASWHARTTGDFNGDGKTDIVMQNDDGSVVIWQMNGNAVTGGGSVYNPGPGWRVMGSGDFDGDGKADVVLQNDNGSIIVWQMNGATVTAVTSPGNPGSAWHVKGTGDYNADGKADILLQNDNGSVAIWETNGGALIGGGGVSFNPGTSWHAIGSDNLNFISGATGNGALAATSQDDVFVFTSFAPGAHAISGFNTAHDLITFSTATFANFAAVQSHSTASGGGTLIALNANSSLLVQGVAPGALTASDFKFV